ncbi:MAG TPA: DUF1080 domain-containing protein [Gemmataceae bacterium]|nr:DUF1080 domain-containing protein [Gemmataceae bacterium]
MRRQFGILTLLAALFLLLGNATEAGGDKNVFFNGKDLDGWNGLTEYWSVKDGAIVGSSAPAGIKFNTFLVRKGTYKDFELSFEVRLKDGKGNSGVQIRSKMKDDKKYVVAGPQCDMADGYWGSLYGELFPFGTNGAMMKAAPKDIVAKAMPKKGEFMPYEIKAVGKHVTIKLNGLTTVDADFPDMPDEGIIALQVHSGGAMEVTFRKIQFKDLTKK